MSAYRKLETRFGRIAALEDTLGILDWDSQTMMPHGAIAGRSDQLAALKVLSHELLVDPRTGDLLGEATGDEAGLDDWQRPSTPGKPPGRRAISPVRNRSSPR
jgi:carboxypeptidase Taq